MIAERITARIIKDSRNDKTIEVTTEIKNKHFVASSPGGASKGKHEAKTFSEKGIDFSVFLLNGIGKKLIIDGISFESFEDLAKVEEIVRKVDKTKEYSIIGANALYALEASLLKAIAFSHGLELWQFFEKPKIPIPVGNCIGGGMHITQEKKADFQEFLIIPRTKNFFDSHFISLQAYKEAKFLLLQHDSAYREGMITDENALATTLDNESILQLLQKIKERIKEKFDMTIDLGIDMAASSFFNINYVYKNFPGKKRMKREEQISYVSELAKKYSLAYIEDPLQEEDFNGFSKITERAKNNALIVGDDLICTQKERLENAIRERAINTVIIKPNQNGSLLETKKIVELAKANDITTIISHRSGETSDNTIAELAVAWNIPYIKTGILGKERFAKLHDLLRIEREMAKKS